ncbi:MAG: hypothetical protein QXZ43_02795 [Candidatus Aenigmatarchaeota archaeon]
MFEEVMLSLKPVLINILPSVFLSILLLIFGWVLARILKGLTEKTLNRLRIDENIKLGKRIGFSELVSVGIFWIIFLVFISASISNLRIDQLTKYFELITDFIINLLSGIIVIIIGYSISSYIQNKIIQSKINNAEIISKIVFVFSLIITIEMALKIIGLPTQLLDAVLIIFVASIGIGLAIAFGLGLKDIVATQAKKTFKD